MKAHSSPLESHSTSGSSISTPSANKRSKQKSFHSQNTLKHLHRLLLFGIVMMNSLNESQSHTSPPSDDSLKTTNPKDLSEADYRGLATTTPAPKRLKLVQGSAASVSFCNDDGCHHNHVTPTAHQKTLTQQEIDQLLWTEAKYSKTSAETTKRSDYLSWDDYFMSVARLSAMRSKDPEHATGACLVFDNRIVGIGYNGFPMGCDDDCLPWKSHSGFSGLQRKAFFVVHAPVNAILNSNVPRTTDRKLYLSCFPCNECAKVIVQASVKEVVYADDRDCNCSDTSSDSARASRILLTLAGVKMTKYETERSVVELEFPREDEGVVLHQNTGEVKDGTDKAGKETKAAKLQYRDLLLQEAKYDTLTFSSGKRGNVLSWDDYFMAVAVLTSHRSKDPNTLVGACIVNKNVIVGLGYNGFPSGCSDDDLPWARQGSSALHCKYAYVCHAEVNAILNSPQQHNLRGATIYVALFPCNECAKLIIQAGIRRVVYMQDKYHDTEACRASRIMLQMANVELEQHTPSNEMIRIVLRSEK